MSLYLTKRVLWVIACLFSLGAIGNFIAFVVLGYIAATPQVNDGEDLAALAFFITILFVILAAVAFWGWDETRKAIISKEKQLQNQKDFGSGGKYGGPVGRYPSGL